MQSISPTLTKIIRLLYRNFAEPEIYIEKFGSIYINVAPSKVENPQLEKTQLEHRSSAFLG